MNHKTLNVLIVIALAAVMVAGTIALGSGNMAFAKSGSGGKMSSPHKAHDKGKGNGNGNDGNSVPTDTQQKQECQTAGGVSPVSLSCTAASTNTITQAGGILGGLSAGSGGKMSSGDRGHDKGNGNGNGNDGISVPTDTK